MTTSPTPRHLAALLVHSGWVRRLARSLVHDDALADDVAQDAWLVALRHPPDAALPPRPWLARVVRNLVLMRARGDARRGRRERAARPEVATVAPTDELIEAVERERQLAALLVRLDEPYRTALLLRYHEGLSAAAIAARLGVPAGTIRWRIKEGLERLRVALDRQHRGERQRWQLALTPFAAVPRRAAEAAGASAAAVKGGLVMSTLIKVAGAVVAVAVAGMALRAAPRKTPASPPAAAAAATPAKTKVAHATVTSPAATAATNALAHPPARVDAAERARLLERIERSRHATAAPSRPSAAATPPLDKAYVREQMRSLLPLLKECYENALEDQPELAGDLVVRFTIVGAPEIGGLVSESSIVDDKSTIADPGLRECVRENIYAAEFPAPPNDGEWTISYPFAFHNDE